MPPFAFAWRAGDSTAASRNHFLPPIQECFSWPSRRSCPFIRVAMCGRCAGKGSICIGEHGEKYLDFASGIAVNLLGHGHPHLTKAMQKQAETLIHVSNLYGSPQGEKFAQRLVDLTFADTVFFTNSGAEAVECAIKTARRYHHANGQSAQARPDHLHQRLPRPDDGDDQRDQSGEDARRVRAAAAGLQGCRVRQSRGRAGGDRRPNTAGFLVEPIQGEGGIRPASKEFMTGLRKACDEHDLMLVLDEVQCGVARTGTCTRTSITGSRRTSSPPPRALAAASRSAPAWRPKRPRPAW